MAALSLRERASRSGALAPAQIVCRQMAGIEARLFNRRGS